MNKPLGYHRQIPRWLRLMGLWDIDGREYRFRIGSWDASFARRWGLQLGVGCGGEDGDHADRATLMITLIWGQFFINLWRGSAWKHDDMWESMGFSFDRDFGDSIHFNWRSHTYIFHLPWHWEQVRHDVQLDDGSWGPWLAEWHTDAEGNALNDGRHKEKHPYRYLLRSGEVQERNATIYVERRERRWRWFQWLPFPRRMTHAISVAFDAEVGERTGSWKGGCVGCSWEMRIDETPREALKRMEWERKFT